MAEGPHAEEYPPTVHERLALIEQVVRRLVEQGVATQAAVEEIRRGLLRKGSI